MPEDKWINSVLQGDAIEVLKKMPDDLVDCALTSPPYFKQRQYDDPDQIGQEEHFREYINYLGDMGDELRRVMKDTGPFFLNIGDKFSPGKRAGLDPRNKMLLPHRTAIEYQSRGWLVRGDYLWSKLSAKPSPAKDRLREEKEFIFHLVQSSDNYFDLDLIRERHEEISIKRMAYGRNIGKHHTEIAEKMDRGTEYIEQEREGAGLDDIREKVKRGETSLHPLGANPGDVMEVAPETKLHEAHFAPFPKDLIRPLIKAGTPKKICKECGVPYHRPDPRETEGVGLPPLEPSCDCDAGSSPGCLLDPFAGSGQALIVAKELGLKYIGIDLKEIYCEMSRKRLSETTVPLGRFL